jgi:hypothetical protein
MIFFTKTFAKTYADLKAICTNSHTDPNSMQWAYRVPALPVRLFQNASKMLA